MAAALSSRRTTAPERRDAGAISGAASRPAAAPRRQRHFMVGALVLTLLSAGAGSACSRSEGVASGSGGTTAPTTAAPGPVSTAGSTLAPGSSPMTSSSSAPTTSGPATGGPTSTSAPAAPPTTATASTAASIAPTSAATSSAAAIAAFCARNAQTSNDFQNLDPSHDFVDYLAKIRQATTELATLAPPTIKADVQTVADAFGRITTTEQMDTLASDPAVKAASDRVSDWTRKHCPEP